MRVLFYNTTSDEHLEISKAQLSKWLVAGLDHQTIDSLVHASVPGLTVTKRSPAIRQTQEVIVDLPDLHDCKIGVVTGDLANVNSAKAWVNPENTKMEMGRFHDPSVSANIRFHGARQKATGFVVNDSIAKTLSKKTKNRPVEPGKVITTQPGELRNRNGVEVLLHVAAFHGQPGKGYSTISDLPDCVTNCLSELDKYNRQRFWRSADSVLFPLFGTWSGFDPQDVANDLVSAVVAYIKRTPQTSIKKILFLAYREYDLDLCMTALQRNKADIRSKIKDTDLPLTSLSAQDPKRLSQT